MIEYIAQITNDKQIQPNGIDLTLRSVCSFDGIGELGEGKQLPKLEEAQIENGAFNLSPGSYLAAYNEKVRIPKGAVGLLLPRSSLMRMGCMLHTALWDQGYEGEGIGLLVVHNPVKIHIGARIGQLIFLNAKKVDNTYSGAYQNETHENRLSK